MKIAIDISGLSWKYRTGVQNLVAAYVESWQQEKESIDAEVFFYDRSGIFNKEISSISGANYISCVPNWAPRMFYRPFQFLIKSGLIHPDNIKNCVNHVWNYQIYNPKSTKATITIHDIFPLTYPQWFSKRFISLTRNSLKFAKNNAQVVFATSEFVKKEIHASEEIPADQIHVVQPGIDGRYFSPIDDSFADQVLKKYDLQRENYVLSSGFIDPRKNLCNQMKAFSQYVNDERVNLKYVFTGLKNNLSEEIIKVMDSPTLRSKICFLGYVSKSELRALLCKSRALMYCSIAEGFGLPIVEAMASGTQVITSNTTSMKDLGKGRAELADPQDIDSISQCIKNTMNLSSEDRHALLDKNKKFASTYTIKNWFKSHLNVWMQIH